MFKFNATRAKSKTSKTKNQCSIHPSLSSLYFFFLDRIKLEHVDVPSCVPTPAFRSFNPEEKEESDGEYDPLITREYNLMREEGLISHKKFIFSLDEILDLVVKDNDSQLEKGLEKRRATDDHIKQRPLPGTHPGPDRHYRLLENFDLEGCEVYVQSTKFPKTVTHGRVKGTKIICGCCGQEYAWYLLLLFT